MSKKNKIVGKIKQRQQSMMSKEDTNVFEVKATILLILLIIILIVFIIVYF